jgi:hypothetical protein
MPATATPTPKADECSVGCPGWSAVWVVISCSLTRRPYLNTNQSDSGAPPPSWRTAELSPPRAPPQTPEMCQPGACPRHSPASQAKTTSPSCTPEIYPSGSLVYSSSSEESIRPFTRVQCTWGSSSFDRAEAGGSVLVAGSGNATRVSTGSMPACSALKHTTRVEVLGGGVDTLGDSDHRIRPRLHQTNREGSNRSLDVVRHSGCPS